MHASVRLEHSLLAVESEHTVHTMLELAAPELPANERAPLRLALVLDRSGSMSGPKLATAVRCARWLAGRLRDDDEIALVDFDDEVRLLHPLGPTQRERLEHALARIAPGGQTNLSGGWLKGLEELRRAPAGVPRKLLLLTDGLANVGITEPGRLVALARGAYGDGVGTSTIGFGDGFDEELLTAMADAGGGNAHYAESPDAAPAIFAQELDGLTRLVAQNASVEIRPAEQVEVVEILNEYPAIAVAGGVQVSLGDAYAGERRRVVLALHLPNVAAFGPAKIADLIVRYVSVGDEVAEHTLTVPVAVNLVSADEAAAAQPDLEVREEVLVLGTAKARAEAIRLADAGERDAAQRLIATTAARLRHEQAAMPAPSQALAEEATALDEVVPLLDLYEASTRKALHYQANARRRRPRPGGSAGG
jgi:Ca-activated chloride channel family protein